ncbi:hypothetical protein T02_14272 [Trichinella nativa]|uniref:Uncharacterized protein n=1 Tax=Trichinella nativa TaxID=6335 RepID=A0A0V1LCV7_9BILA|nr:hypothetical protein T02_14272 [Trichinella nativa]
MELLYSHIVKILTEDDLILSKTFQETFLTNGKLEWIRVGKELEIKVILPTEFRDEGITQRFIKWLLGDRAVEGLCKIQLCPVLCMTKKSSREGVPETNRPEKEEV